MNKIGNVCVSSWRELCGSHSSDVTHCDESESINQHWTVLSNWQPASLVHRIRPETNSNKKVTKIRKPGWQNEAGSWLQRQTDARWNERPVS